MLKVDLHLHSSEDPRDALDYSACDLIRRAAYYKFDAIALTLHGRVLDDRAVRDCAAINDVLFIPGIEKRIHGKEVLVYNVTQAEIDAVHTFEDLRELRIRRGNEILIIAPHPFFQKAQCLGHHLEKNIDLFDAIEYCHLYTRFWNLNRRAVEVAQAHGKAMVATSDSHALWMFGKNYTWVDAPPTMEGIFGAICDGHVRPHSEPVTPMGLARKMGWFWTVHKARKLARYVNGAKHPQQAVSGRPAQATNVKPTAA